MGKERKSWGWTSAHLRAKGSLSHTTQNWSAVLLESSGELRYSLEPTEERRALVSFCLEVEDKQGRCPLKMWKGSPAALGMEEELGATRSSGWCSQCLTAVFSLLQSLPPQSESDSSWARRMTAQHPLSSSPNWMSCCPWMGRRWNGRRQRGEARWMLQYWPGGTRVGKRVECEWAPFSNLSTLNNRWAWCWLG